MDFLKAIVRRRSADQDAEVAHTPAEQTAAHVTVSSISQGSAGLSTLLRIPPAAARSFGDDASTPAACTPVPDVEAQLGNHSQSDMQAECRICLSAGSAGHDLFQPCACAGTMGYTHAACLAAWVQEKGSLTCELCKQRYKEPYVQALGFCIRASWGEQQHLHAAQPPPQQQQHPGAGVGEGQEARQAATSPSTCYGCLQRMTVGQWFCLMVVTVFLVTFVGVGVGVGMARTPTAAPAAPPKTGPGPQGHVTVFPRQFPRQIEVIECEPIAGARYGICRRRTLPFGANTAGVGLAG